jgi:hypothetical protein
MLLVNLVDELYAVGRALHGAGIPHAVCGGLAVTIHGATRTTKGLDLLVPRAPLPAALEAVRPLGYVYAALPTTFDRGTPRERHLQRVTKAEGEEHLILDLIIADGPFLGLLADRVEITLPQGPLSVVSLASLAKMKRLAGRPQDVADRQKLGLPVEEDPHG